MEPRPTGETEDDLRNAYLALRGALHDRATELPAYPVVVDALRAALDARRQIGVVHVDVTHLDLVESLFGWQAFDRAMAHLAGRLRALPGRELPPSTLLAVGEVPADRFVVFVLETRERREVEHADLAAFAAAVKGALDDALGAADFADLAPRLLARVGYALLSENPFFRFERRVHAAVEEARTLPDRRAARREEAWRDDLERVIREARVRMLWQPVVELASRDVVGFEALARGPEDTLLESPRAMFALSGRAGTAGDLDRLCRESALREGASLARSRKLFLNVLPATLADAGTWGGLVRDLFVAGGGTPGDVVVEVSERALGENAAALSPACAALRERGFAVGLDDVGTGRDGALALDALRPDFVKVDATLIRGIESSLIRQEIFGSIVKLGAAIDAAVVGVGIESEGEAKTLEALGARYGQGYHFAGPAPRERWAS